MKKVGARRETLQELDITPEERDKIKEHFQIIDVINTGFIDFEELRLLLERIGETVSDERMVQIIEILEERGIKKVDLFSALKVWSHVKEWKTGDEEDDQSDVLHAFVAMGGNSDKTGIVKKQTLVDIIKNQFGLTIDIEGMLEEAGIDIDDELNYSDFSLLFGSGGSQRSSRICSIFSEASF